MSCFRMSAPRPAFVLYPGEVNTPCLPSFSANASAGGASWFLSPAVRAGRHWEPQTVCAAPMRPALVSAGPSPPRPPGRGRPRQCPRQRAWHWSRTEEARPPRAVGRPGGCRQPGTSRTFQRKQIPGGCRRTGGCPEGGLESGGSLVTEKLGLRREVRHRLLASPYPPVSLGKLVLTPQRQSKTHKYLSGI